jgi:8-oxo-dGTP pyrophosphatase MutT (NUDIX family)
VQHLRHFAAWFFVGTRSIVFGAELDDLDARIAAMAKVALALRDFGLLTAWRNETCDIGHAAGGPGFFRLERAAVRYSGILAQAVHVNGLVRDGEQLSMWIGRRSPDKAIDPGKLDNMVGGGLASGLSIRETLAKEAWEEAGIPRDIADTATARGIIRVQRGVPEGLHFEIIHVYDLYLPSAFQSHNQDGEVAELQLSALADVVRQITSDADFTVYAAPVARDCLVRHDALPAHWAEVIRTT